MVDDQREDALTAIRNALGQRRLEADTVQCWRVLQIMGALVHLTRGEWRQAVALADRSTVPVSEIPFDELREANKHIPAPELLMLLQGLRDHFER